MTTSTAPLIQLRALTKRFGSRLALDRLDLDVESGEVFGILGHNGAGKSTAIGMMLGQVWPTSGDVRICGADVTRHRQAALARVGAIFETPVFYDYLSGWRNLQILASYTAPTPDTRLREVLDWVGLTGREHSKVRTYSHGMRARLALAQALAPAPQLLILDEPSDGLDPEGIHEMRQTILRLRRELGLTIFLSSHLLNEVEQLCTRIAVLREGRKVFDGPLTEVIRKHNWFRLRTDDFPKAAAVLGSEGLAQVIGPNGRLQLLGNVTSDWVVERLVAAGVRVYEIAVEEQTLEDFYLGIMKQPAPPTAAANGGSGLAG
jgi:ABC-2 type transport system ATP-binding protein